MRVFSSASNENQLTQLRKSFRRRKYQKFKDDDIAGDDSDCEDIVAGTLQVDISERSRPDSSHPNSEAENKGHKNGLARKVGGKLSKRVKKVTLKGGAKGTSSNSDDLIEIISEGSQDCQSAPSDDEKVLSSNITSKNKVEGHPPKKNSATKRNIKKLRKAGKRVKKGLGAGIRHFFQGYTFLAPGPGPIVQIFVRTN